MGKERTYKFNAFKKHVKNRNRFIKMYSCMIKKKKIIEKQTSSILEIKSVITNKKT
jgi:hypothetical protein